MTTREATSSSSRSGPEIEEVQAQLESLLVSPQFRQSKRYPAFLRYVVETTLRGDEDELKERTIGIEVFGRLPHYDTSSDPTVRLTAAEVRKRLAQYYQQPDHADELHIELRPGSYVPAFSWPTSAIVPETIPATGVEAVPDSVMPVGEVIPTAVTPPQRRSLFLWLPLAAGLAALVAGVALWIYVHNASAVGNNAIVSPLLNDPRPVTLVLPDLSKAELLPETQETQSTTVLTHIRNNRIVDFNDSVVLAQLASILGRANKPHRVMLSSDASFEDLQTGPSILIGAVDNPWAMRFLEPLPYSVKRRGTSMTFEIAGKKNGSASWSIDLSEPFGNVQEDYGVVVREMDSMTGRPVLVVAGLGQNGTSAGMRLLAEPALARQITAAAPKAWSGRNLEVVFRTQVIHDNFGPPVIVASEYW